MRFDHINAEQGLSHFSPTVIIQDKQGFLWFGTEDGLNRYDGYNFVVFRNSLRDTSTIAANAISGLCVDSDGNLWMTSSSGEAHKYNVNTNKFVKYKLIHRNIPAHQPLTAGNMVADDDGVLWVASNYGLIKFNAHTGTVESVFMHDSTNPSSLTNDAVRAVCRDSSGNIWIGTINGVSRLEKRSNRITPFFPSKTSGLNKTHDDVFALAVDGRGVLWIGTVGGLLRFRPRGASASGRDPGTNQFIPSTHRLPSGNMVGGTFIYSLSVDDQGVLWVGSYAEGLLKHVPVNNTFIQQRHDPKNPRSIGADRISCIYQDRSGVLWVGMYRTGLSRYDRKKDQFMQYPSSADVFAVCEDSRGDVWFGTAGNGVLLYRKGAAIPETLRHNPTNPNSLGDDNVYSFREEANGDMWIGISPGLDRYVRATRTFKHYKLGRGQDDNLETKAVYTDRDGELWVGSNGMGLLRYDKARDAFVNYRHDPHNTQSISGGGVWSIYQDSKRRLWVPTFGGGLNLLDKTTTMFSHFVLKDRDTNALSSNSIYCMTEDAKGNLWMGTFGGGLNRLDTTTWQFKTYRVEDGLPDNFVKTILVDSHGNLWMGTDKGLSCFDVSAEQFTNYKVSDGLHGNVFLSGAAYKNPKGRFYFGGEKGVTAFYPDSLERRSYKPPVVITGFQVLGKPYPLERSIMLIRQIDLAYDENSFSFEFVSLDYSSPDKNEYAYKLDGIDSELLYVGTRRYANYTQVSPGKYRFRVSGTNSDGIWNFDGASILIVIAPPFWATWWFRLSAALLLIGVGVALYNYRVNRLLEIERLRVRIASDLHDDIGSSLTRISLQSELIQEGIEPEEQQNYLKNIAAMSRELVTSMADIVWSIDSRNDSIEDLLTKMRSFGTTVLSAKDVSFRLAHSGLDMKKKLSPEVRENLYLVYKEAINNIAKHASASSVNVVLRNDTDKFTMTIIDDGGGWEGHERPSGHGMKNMRMRAERLGGTIEFVRDEGTRVMLTIKRI